jgi:hypothetical protein
LVLKASAIFRQAIFWNSSAKRNNKRALSSEDLRF